MQVVGLLMLLTLMGLIAFAGSIQDFFDIMKLKMRIFTDLITFAGLPEMLLGPSASNQLVH